MRVGTPSTSYPYRRNIIGMVPGAEYRRVLGSGALLSAVGRRLNHVARRQLFATTDLENRFRDPGLGRVDLYHFINAVSTGRTPWLTTFETVVPRFSSTLTCHHGPEPTFAPLATDANVRRALEAMAGEPCKRLIALSECNAAMQRELLGVFPDLAPSIERKLTVMPPPQSPVLASLAEKPVSFDGELTFMLVGSQFFSKGGREVVETLARLRAEGGYPLRLVVVSALVTDGYATMTGPADIAWAKAAFAEHAGWVEHHRQLPNADVLELMTRAHIGMLPAHAETYGYSALEFQAAGCPVITTDVRALPEINAEERGWVIPVPKNRLGEAVYTSAEAREALSSAIRRGLERAVTEAFADREMVARKGEAALAQVMAEHSLSRYAARLAESYAEAVEGEGS